MKTIILMVTLLFYTSVFAAEWVRFHKEGETQLYYDAGSYSCYRTFDRRSGITTGHIATVWIKTSPPSNSTKDNVKIWSLDCSGRKIDKEGRDHPDIYGDHVRPDSAEEKLYKKICTICRSMQYDR